MTWRMYSNTQSESNDDKKIGEMKICINIKKSHQMWEQKKLFMLALFAVHIQNNFYMLGVRKKGGINCRNKYETFSMVKLNLEKFWDMKKKIFFKWFNEWHYVNLASHSWWCECQCVYVFGKLNSISIFFWYLYKQWKIK